MDITKIKLVAFDLDGTLSQHKTHMPPQNRQALEALGRKYKLLMVGAGQVMRIFGQMEQFPIDIIGNYGMQFGKYNSQTKDIDILRDDCLPCNRDSIEQKVTKLRQRYGWTDFKGDNVEFHPSGCVTFPILGTKAESRDKLVFDPDRVKHRRVYDEVAKEFSDYHVFVGGSSSFDIAPKPFNKYYALDLYCKENNLGHHEVVFVGDDYGPGGNDNSVYDSDFGFLKIDNFEDFPKVISPLL